MIDDSRGLGRAVDALTCVQGKLDVVSLAILGLADAAPDHEGSILNIRAALDEALRELEQAIQLGMRPVATLASVA
jgi:hypothetical protein